MSSFFDSRALFHATLACVEQIKGAPSATCSPGRPWLLAFAKRLRVIKRSEAKKLVEKHNGKVSSSVSKNTNFLVAGKNSGSKLVKAKKIGIKIISESDFIRIVN